MSQCSNRERMRIPVIAPRTVPPPATAPAAPSAATAPAPAPTAGTPRLTSSTRNVLVTGLTTALFGGGSLAAALSRGATSGVSERWGVQIAATAQRSIFATSIVADGALGDLFVAGSYQGLATFTTTSDAAFPSSLSAGGGAAGYVGGVDPLTGSVDWLVNVETADANSAGVTVSDLAVGPGSSLFAAGMFDFTSASATLSTKTGSTSAPTPITRSSPRPAHDGLFVLRVDTDSAQVDVVHVEELMASTVEGAPKVVSDGVGAVHVACTESVTNTTVLTIQTQAPAETLFRTRFVNARLRDLAYVSATVGDGVYVAVLDALGPDLAIERTNYTHSESAALPSGLGAAGTSVVVALAPGSITPQWAVSAPADALEIVAAVDDGDGGVYFAGTQRGAGAITRFAPSGGALVAGASQSLPSNSGASDIVVGHVRPSGINHVFFQPGGGAQIGGQGADYAVDIDYNRNSNRLVVGGAITNLLGTSGANLQSVVISIDTTTATPSWKSIVSGEREDGSPVNTPLPFSVAALPTLSAQPDLEAALTGSFANSFRYRNVSMSARGYQDGFVLPATAAAAR